MKIFIPYEPANWNEYIKLERASIYGANALKQKEKKIVALTVEEKYTGKYPVELSFTAHFKNKRKDLDNFRIKGVIDGLVSSGIIKNDNTTYIQKITLKVKFDDIEGIDIEIKEIEDE